MKAHKELSIYSLISIFLLYAFILYFLTDSPPPPLKFVRRAEGDGKRSKYVMGVAFMSEEATPKC